MTDVLALVVAYGNYFHTKNTIDALKLQKTPVDIAVWNNDQDLAVQSRLAEDPDIQYYNSPENILWTPALNKGIEKFWDGQKYLLLMNNDISLQETTVDRMIEVASKPETGLCAPWGAGLGGQQDFAVHFYHSAIDNMDEKIKDLEPIRTTFVLGACVMLRKEVYDEIGPYDEEMPLGADDHDYAIRVKANGYHIYVVRNVYASHVSHATGDSSNWDNHGGPSWQRFNEKWAGYYKTEDEAIKSHWGTVYTPGYDK